MLALQILIVEDDRDIADLLEETLTRNGFSCRLCHDGLRGLELAKELQPDLIILDLLLPGLDGLELCARLRQKPLTKDPYILMLTGKSDEIDRIVGLSTGADDYMHLMSQPGRVWQREQLIERVWGSDYFGDDRVVDTHLARLRKKMKPHPSEPVFIKTVIGVGYKFEDLA